MKLKNIRRVESLSLCYDIQTKTNNFFANNILVHNSTLIVSKYKGKYILRTRGTVDATKMDNGAELEIFKETILPILDVSEMETWPSSIVFEWVSPQNKIVIQYNTAQWYLIGIIKHGDYSLWPQIELDLFAKNHGLLRPATYTFKDISSLMDSVEKWEGKEGVVLYSKNGQEMHKIKSFQYLKLHRFKSEATFENTVELFFAFDMPSYKEFEAKLINEFDYECFSMVRGFLSTICDGWKEVLKIESHMKLFVEPLKNIHRRDAASKILGSYSNSNRSQYCFKLLDGKPLDKEMYKKLLYQVTKND